MFINFVLLHVSCFWLSICSPHWHLKENYENRLRHLRSNGVDFEQCVLNNIICNDRTYLFCREQDFWRNKTKKNSVKCHKPIKAWCIDASCTPFMLQWLPSSYSIFSLPEQHGIFSYKKQNKHNHYVVYIMFLLSSVNKQPLHIFTDFSKCPLRMFSYHLHLVILLVSALRY